VQPEQQSNIAEVVQAGTEVQHPENQSASRKLAGQISSQRQQREREETRRQARIFTTPQTAHMKRSNSITLSDTGRSEEYFLNSVYGEPQEIVNPCTCKFGDWKEVDPKCLWTFHKPTISNDGFRWDNNRKTSMRNAEANKRKRQRSSSESPASTKKRRHTIDYTFEELAGLADIGRVP
jgi:hypothetical protein